MAKRQSSGRPRFLAVELNSDLRGWLVRIAISLAAALLAGALTFLIARAITSVALFVQQQELLREASSALQGGILGLAESNLREVRLRVQQIDARNERISLLVGFGAAGLAAVASYLWMEQRSSLVRSPSSVAADHEPRTRDTNGN